jgi:chemotaxis response regulator CheB
MAHRARTRGKDARAGDLDQSPGATGGPETPDSNRGLGASAGGLEALTRFFRAMPPDSGMAFVIVQHLDPSHGSLMAELLGRCTAMPSCRLRPTRSSRAITSTASPRESISASMDESCA